MSRETRTARRTALVGGIAVSAVCVGGIAYAINHGPSDAAAHISAPVGAAADYAAGQRLAPMRLSGTEAARAVMAGVKGSAIQAVDVVVSVPDQPGPVSAAVTTTVEGLKADSAEAHWLGALVQGAVADLMRGKAAATQDVRASSEVVGIQGDGTTSHDFLGVGYAASGQHFAAAPDPAIRERVARVATEFNLQTRSITILHPLESALWVQFTVPTDGEVPWTLYQLSTALEGSPRTFEGICIELYSANGDKLLTYAGAYRAGLGSLWFAPGQDGRFGAVHG